MTCALLLVAANSADIAANRANTDEVTWIAGTGAFGFSGDGGPALAAELASPTAVAVAPDGTIFFVDLGAYRVRRISPNGVIDTIAGNGDLGATGDGGPATSASLSDSFAIALDAGRNLLYIAEVENDRVRRVNLATGIIDTFATFTPVNGHLVRSMGIAVDLAGNVYVAATDVCRIYVYWSAGGSGTIAGTGQWGLETCPPTVSDLPASNGDGGPAADAPVMNPQGLAVDAAGNLFVVERGTARWGRDSIRRIDAVTGIITTVAGGGILSPDAGGPATAIDFGNTSGIATDAAPGGATRLFVAVESGARILAVDLATSALSVFAGTGNFGLGCEDGPASSIEFSGVWGLAYSSTGKLIVADNLAHRLCSITAAGLPPAGDVSFIGTTRTRIDCPPGLLVANNVAIIGNAFATHINCGALQSAVNVNISDNSAANTVVLVGLTSVGGDVMVVGITSAPTVVLGSLASVGGNSTIESTGTGTFDIDACVAGSSDIAATGYASVLAATAGVITNVRLQNDHAITVAMQPNTVSTCTPFAITRVPVGPEAGTAADGSAANVDPIDAYQVVMATPTLDRPATLTFDIIMANLGSARQAEVLEAFSARILTLVTKSDNAGSPFQSFPICASGEEPAADGCAALQTLDADGNPTSTSPAVVRFTAAVGHFSTWGVAIVSSVTSSAAFNGLLQPYPAPPLTATPTFKRGSVVPVRFNWVDTGGTAVDSAAAAPAISIHSSACAAQPPATDAVMPDDAGASGWHYDVDTRTWTFGWSTKRLAAGCYWIQVTTGTPAFPAPGAMFPVVLRDR